jgi:putative ABC transport system ATP-binding protein
VRYGSCVVLGQELRDADERTRVALRRKIGFVFQDHRLLEFLTARENVALALEAEPTGSERERTRRARDALAEVGLNRHTDALPRELSGGQRQRVAVARALVRDPTLILADEPTAALDSQSGAEVTELLAGLARGRGASVLIVTHDMRIAGYADRVVRIEDGVAVPQHRSPDKMEGNTNVSLAHAHDYLAKVQ